MTTLMNKKHFELVLNALPPEHRSYVLTSSEVIVEMQREHGKDYYTYIDFVRMVTRMMQGRLILLTHIPDTQWNIYLHYVNDFDVSNALNIYDNPVLLIQVFSTSIRAKSITLASCITNVSESIKQTVDVTKKSKDVTAMVSII